MRSAGLRGESDTCVRVEWQGRRFRSWRAAERALLAAQHDGTGLDVELWYWTITDLQLLSAPAYDERWQRRYTPTGERLTFDEVEERYHRPAWESPVIDASWALAAHAAGCPWV